MKFICNKNRLHDAITNVSKAVATKSNIAALEGMKLKLTENNLELTGFDLELGIRTNLEVNSESSGELVINSRLFSEIIRKMSSDEVTVTIDEKLNVNITGNDTTYDISAMPPDEYPAFPVIDNEKYFEIPQYILKNMIEHTNHAVSINDSKPILTGELFDIYDNIFRMVAIDGFRLAVRTEPAPGAEETSFVVPSKTLNEISKLLAKGDMAKSSSDDSGQEQNDAKTTSDETCKIYTSAKNIIFEISGYIVVSRLLEGEFLNYTTAIPLSGTTIARVDTKTFIKSIERTSLIITDKFKSPLRCIFDTDSIKISSVTSVGTANDKIPAKIDGGRVEIGFNNRYIFDALKNCNVDEVRIELNGPTSPIVILPPENDNFLYLVLPMRLKA